MGKDERRSVLATYLKWLDENYCWNDTFDFGFYASFCTGSGPVWTACSAWTSSTPIRDSLRRTRSLSIICYCSRWVRRRGAARTANGPARKRRGWIQQSVWGKGGLNCGICLVGVGGRPIVRSSLLEEQAEQAFSFWSIIDPKPVILAPSPSPYHVGRSGRAITITDLVMVRLWSSVKYTC